MSIAYSETERNVVLDEFITPAGLVKAGVELLYMLGFCGYSGMSVLDPGANTGQWSNEVRFHFPNAAITGVEIMDNLPLPLSGAFNNFYVDDFLTWTTDEQYDVVIGNPPYSDYRSGKRKTVADAFVEKSLNLLKPDGFLIFLLRRNFACGVKRNTSGVLKTNPFRYEYRCVRRPSFSVEDTRYLDGRKKTNAHDYSIFIWHNTDGYFESISRPLFWKY